MHKHDNDDIFGLLKSSKKLCKSSVEMDIEGNSKTESWVNNDRSLHRNIRFYRKPNRFASIDDEKDNVFQLNKLQRMKDNKKPNEPAFIRPVKKQRFSEIYRQDNQVECLEESVIEIKKEKKRVEQEECPFCSEILEPLTIPIKRFLEQYKNKNNEYIEREKMRQQKEDSKSSFSRPAELIIEKRHISDTDKQEFCKLHKLELHLKPLGNIRGYPISIDFNCIEKRIKGFQGQLEDIIHGRIQSKFKNIVTNAYNEYGTVKARSAAFLMLRVDKCMPGYYGSQGMAIISSILTKMFIQSDILTKETAKPLLLLEFIQQVLVPEVGIRLIREDLSSKSNMGKSKQTNILHYAPRVPLPNLTEIAEKVMSESREYGSAMFPILEDLVVSLSDEEEQ